MTDIAKRIAASIEIASDLSKKGSYREAAEHYLEAAQLAGNNLKDKRLKYLCDHHYLLELLTAESGQDRELIRRIIQNLRGMKQDIDDDRLSTQVNPIIHYFEVLYLTVGDDIEALSKKIQTLRKQTDDSRDFFNSIAHVLADMMYVVECIRPYKRATDIPQHEFENRKQHLISCIRARKEYTAIPDLFQKILSEFELALVRSKNPDSVERAISGFKQAIYNPDNQLLKIAVETIKHYLFEILNSSEKGDNMVSPAETEQNNKPAGTGRNRKATIFAIIISFFVDLVFELLVYFIPITWVKNHPNSYGLQGSIIFLIPCLIVGLFKPQYRKWCWGVGAIAFIVLLLSLMGGPADSNVN